MQIPAISPNIIVIAVVAGGALYGGMGGKHRLKLLILSTYVGIVLATQLAAVVVSFTHQSIDIVTLSLFALPILIFGFSGHSPKREHPGTLIANCLVGLAAGALIVASALKLLPPSEAASVTDGSLVATELMMIQLWLVGLLPVAAFVFGLMKGKDKH